MQNAFDFSLLGRRCSIAGAVAAQEAWIRQHWYFPDDVAKEHPLEISIRFSNEPLSELQSPSSQPHTPIDGLTLTWRQHGPRAWNTDAVNGGVRLEIEPDSANINVWCAGVEELPIHIAAALHVAICEALRSTGLMPLRAAIVAREGVALALTGERLTRKSTALKLVQEHGWQLLAEDFAWLDVDETAVYGWDQGIRLTGEHAVRVTHAMQPKASLTRVAVLQQDAARESVLEQLGPREAVKVLFESSGAPLCRYNRNAFAARLPWLIEKLEISRLIVGVTALPL